MGGGDAGQDENAGADNTADAEKDQVEGGKLPVQTFAFLDRKQGHVVNVASLAGRYATPSVSVYSATKHAVVAFSESLFYELEPYGVKRVSERSGKAGRPGQVWVLNEDGSEA